MSRYNKEWLQSLPIGTQLIFGNEPAENAIISEKKYRMHDKVQRYAKLPGTTQPLRIYFDDAENQIRMAYHKPTQDYPLEGRLQGVIYPEKPVS